MVSKEHVESSTNKQASNTWSHGNKCKICLNHGVRGAVRGSLIGGQTGISGIIPFLLNSFESYHLKVP